MKKILSILLLVFILGCVSGEGKEKVEEPILDCLSCHVDPPGPHQEVSCIICHAPMQDIVDHYDHKISIEPNLLTCMMCHVVFNPENSI